MSAGVVIVGLVETDARRAQMIKDAIQTKLPDHEVIVISGCTVVAVIETTVEVSR